MAHSQTYISQKPSGQVEGPGAAQVEVCGGVDIDHESVFWALDDSLEVAPEANANELRLDRRLGG